MKKKKVSCIVEEIPSYLGHILSVARIGFESDYSDKYSYSVEPEDIQWLKENEELVLWGNGKAGPLTGYGLFILGYVNPKGADGISSYFDSLYHIIEKGDCSIMLDTFPALKRYHDSWFKLDHPKAIEILKKHRHDLKRLESVFIRNWNIFDKKVWPVEKPKLSSKADELNERLARVDLIGRWEKATGFTFKYDHYYYVLSSGMKNAPRFNSLGYGKNWVYYDCPLLFEGIAHEVGSHLLIGLKHEAYEKYDYFVTYNVRETLCHFLTKLIFKDLGFERTPLDGSKVYSAKADKLFGENIFEIPVPNLKKVFTSVLKQVLADDQK